MTTIIGIIFFTVFWIVVISALSKPSDGNYGDKSLKKFSWSKFFVIINIIIGVLILATIGFNYFDKKSAKDDSTLASKADGFEINKYDIVLDVKEDNTVDVQENITINFTKSGKHGIYRFMPEWLEYTAQDGNTISRKYSIDHLTSDENFTTDTVNGKKRIKVGSANVTLTKGLHKYTFNYQINMGEDPWDNFDEFIFHAFGDYWGTPIEDSSIVIKMPEKFNIEDIKFFNDKYRKKDITNDINYQIKDNTIYITLKSGVSLTKSLTIDISLPDNSFINTKDSYGPASMILCISIIFFFLITLLLWFIYGKDKPIINVVGFYPPDKLDASEIGYIYKNDSGRKLAISLIVSLASKGYISIEQDNDNAVIRNLASDVEIDNSINRVVKLKKTDKYFKSNALSSYEKKALEEVFDNKDTVDIKENIDEALAKVSVFITLEYVEKISDTKDNYTDEQLQEIRNNINKLHNLKPLTENEQMVYNTLFETEKNIVTLRTHHTFYKVYNELAKNLSKKYDKLLDNRVSKILSVITSLFFTISAFLFLAAFGFIKDLNPAMYIMYIIAFICMVFIAILSIFMPRKTDYHNHIVGELNGFKDYLVTAEKDTLNEQVNKNPNYFFDILPYAYVLGVTSAWIKRFEENNLPITNNFFDNKIVTTCFDTINDDIYYEYVSTLRSSSGGGSSSSCGGGCSSCGGGCSSCGGGGSW